MDNEKIGKYIKKKRKEKGLTQQKLGDMVGVSFKAVSKWECGNSIPDIVVLKKVCDVLEISIDELLNAQDKKMGKRKKIGIVIMMIVIIFLVIVYFGYDLIMNDNNVDDSDYIFECVLVKTYNIDNINPSNDENYLYVTFKEYQVEGVYTLKLSKTISKDLVVGENYEFTFNTDKDYISETPDVIFNNSELINIVYSDKVGMEQRNEFTCK